MADDPRSELASIAAAVRAHVEVEASLGNAALPVRKHTLVATAAAAERPSTADEVVSAVSAPAPAQAAASLHAAAEPGDKLRRLELLATEAAACHACALHEKRKRSVFARGNPDSEVVFVGEGPGHEEDLQGLPFVGPAGQLLDRMIAAMGYARDEVYICNVVKCRPPENRTPRAEEAIACARFLVPQLDLVAPRVIVALGRCAAENLHVAPEGGGAWRGRWGAWRGIPVMPTYHPAYLLRSPDQKRVVWQDLQEVMSRLGRTPPPRARRS